MKKILLTIFIIILLILIIGMIFFLLNDKEKLQINPKPVIIDPLIKLGYQQDDVLIIKEKLNDEEIKTLLTLPYDENLIGYLTTPNFCFNKLERYQNYAKNYKNNAVLMVNMNRDIAFYQSINEVNNPNDIDVLINKYYRLPQTYQPKVSVINLKYNPSGGMAADIIMNDFEQMMEASLKDGMKIQVSSAFRTQSIQSTLYNGYVKVYGVERADIGSARPRHSEHETGLAIDLKRQGEKYSTFGLNPEYQWILNNSYKYGFIVRYPEEKTDITGYKFEPWHIRYVGKNAAKVIWQEKITLEEYYAKYKELEC